MSNADRDGNNEDAEPDLEALEPRLLPLRGAGVEPSPGLWDRISAGISADAAAPGTVTIPNDAGIWEPLAEGIVRKVVHVDRGGGRLGYFVRMRAGAVLPHHAHDIDEHCVVLAGELEVAGSVFGAGSYHLARAGSDHAPIRARSDAMFFIYGGMDSAA